jgi:hypothetical protein
MIAFARPDPPQPPRKWPPNPRWQRKPWVFIAAACWFVVVVIASPFIAAAWATSKIDPRPATGRFQFSMRRLFAVVTIICIELGALRALASAYSDPVSIAIVAATVIFTSALVSGLMLRRPLAGALWGGVIIIAMLTWILLRHGPK